MTPGLTKGNKHHYSQHPHLFSSGVNPLYPLSGLPYSPSTSFPTVTFLRRKCIPNIQTSVESSSHMPESSAHFRIHKQARSRRLSTQSKYHESMTSSTISNIKLKRTVCYVVRVAPSGKALNLWVFFHVSYFAIFFAPFSRVRNS